MKTAKVYRCRAAEVKRRARVQHAMELFKLMRQRPTIDFGFSDADRWEQWFRERAAKMLCPLCGAGFVAGDGDRLADMFQRHLEGVDHA